MKKSLLLIISACLIRTSYGAIYPPDLHWKMMKSDHFIVVYHQNETTSAQYLLYYAEEAYENLRTFWHNDMPHGSIYLLLVDNVDYSNGIATILPYNSITIYLKAPTGEDFLGNYENWLKTVIYHELMHIIHLNQSHGIYRYLHKIFGRNPVLYPNIFQPLWSVEGLATYAETRWTTKGRGRAADVNMIFKMASLADQLLSMDQATGPLIKWPGSHTSYLFGYSFLNYLSVHYPDKNLYEVNKSNSSTIIPFRIYKSFKKIYNKNLENLWNDWQSDLVQQYQQNIPKLHKPEVLLNRGYFIFQPVFSSNNKEIYYSISDPHTFPKICKSNLGSRQEKCFLDRYYGNYLSIAQDSLIFSQLEKYRSFYTYSDLYSYSLTYHKTSRLTYGMRARDADYSLGTYAFIIDEPYGSSIATLKNTDVPCKKEKCNSLHILLKGTEGVQFSGLRWNKEKKIIAASKWSPNGIMSILIFNEKGEIINEIGKNEARYLSPIWSANGEYLFFSSDLSGIFNIYSYALNSNKICKVTDEISGAFYPAVSDKLLAYIRYSDNGYQVASIHYTADSLECAESIAIIPSENPKIPELPEKYYKESAYSELNLLWPRYWTPWLSTSGDDMQLGLFTSGNDLLYHTYSLSLSYGLRSKDYLYNIFYAFDRFYPTLGFNLKKDLSWYGDNDYSTKIINEAFISIPYKKIKQNLFAIISLSNEKQSIHNYSKFDKFSFIWFNFKLRYSSARQYLYSISPVDGRIISIEFHDALNRNKINGSFYKTQIEWDEFIPFFFMHHVIALKTAYGTSWGSSRYRIGYFIGGNVHDPDLLPLRGYKENAFLATKAFCANLEYHAPLLNIEKGKGNFPVFLQRIHAAAFIDLTHAYYFGQQWITKKGIGAELSLDTTLGYQVNATLSAGYARGVDKEGINQFYIRFSSLF